jgi:hypothetical protein
MSARTYSIFLIMISGGPRDIYESQPGAAARLVTPCCITGARDRIHTIGKVVLPCPAVDEVTRDSGLAFLSSLRQVAGQVYRILAFGPVLSVELPCEG